MGAAFSGPPLVKVTDRKTLILDHCLQRRDYFADAPVQCPKTGALLHAGPNASPILLPKALAKITQFTAGQTFLRCLETCPLWFATFLRSMDEQAAALDDEFRQSCKGVLELDYGRTEWSPVHVELAEGGERVRMDRILLAHVVGGAGASYELGYTFEAGRPASRPSSGPSRGQAVVAPPNASGPRRHRHAFRFSIQGAGSSRHLWLHKDISRFHGDETRVAVTPNVTPVCVGDRVEIAVTLTSPLGAAKDIKVQPLRVLPAGAAAQLAACPLESQHLDWYDIDEFQAQSVERLQVPDFFAPQLVHQSTRFAGIDIAVCRSHFRVNESGPVERAVKSLGTRLEVLAAGSPIILPLKRVGLQHDRFTKLQIRGGDQLTLYITLGGKM